MPVEGADWVPAFAWMTKRGWQLRFAHDGIADVDSALGCGETSLMSDGPTRYWDRHPFRAKILLSISLGCVVLVGGHLWLNRYIAYDVSAHTPRQNLVHLGATDVCEMLPLSQFGSPFDKTGRRISAVITVYLRAPEGRRPKTGDVLEIKYPKELTGQVRFTQTTDDGFGGSGPLEWFGKKREAELAMAVWDFTHAGSLQYRKGETLLWGDCKKFSELKG